MRTLKGLGYFKNDNYPIISHKRYNVVAAHKSDDIHYEMKKREITLNALEHIYTSPCVKQHYEITPRQMRLKMILHEALDIAHYICDHGDADECRWAWEVVDEIDDTASRAGVRYY